MQHETGEQKDRDPRQVAERQHPAAGQELAQDIHVAQRRVVARAGPDQHAAVGGIEDRIGDLPSKITPPRTRRRDRSMSKVA